MQRRRVQPVGTPQQLASLVYGPARNKKVPPRVRPLKPPPPKPLLPAQHALLPKDAVPPRQPGLTQPLQRAMQLRLQKPPLPPKFDRKPPVAVVQPAARTAARQAVKPPVGQPHPTLKRLKDVKIWRRNLDHTPNKGYRRQAGVRPKQPPLLVPRLAWPLRPFYVGADGHKPVHKPVYA